MLFDVFASGEVEELLISCQEVEDISTVCEDEEALSAACEDADVDEMLFCEETQDARSKERAKTVNKVHIRRIVFFIQRIIHVRFVLYHAISPLRRYRETGKADERRSSKRKRTYASICSLASIAGFFVCRLSFTILGWLKVF